MCGLSAARDNPQSGRDRRTVSALAGPEAVPSALPRRSSASPPTHTRSAPLALLFPLQPTGSRIRRLHYVFVSPRCDADDDDAHLLPRRLPRSSLPISPAILFCFTPATTMAFVAVASVALGSAATTARATCQYVLPSVRTRCISPFHFAFIWVRLR